MATFSKILLSGGTTGKNIKVVATSSAGTTIHTAVAGTSNSRVGAGLPRSATPERPGHQSVRGGGECRRRKRLRQQDYRLMISIARFFPSTKVADWASGTISANTDGAFAYWTTGSPSTGTYADGATTYRFLKWTSSGTLTTTGRAIVVDVLAIAGGGGGAIAGGGAGGMFEILDQALPASGQHVVTVGAGGAAGAGYTDISSSGSDSVFAVNTATGGGYGGREGSTHYDGDAGGSGGGGGNNTGGGFGAGGGGTSGQGFAGSVGASGSYGGGGGGVEAGGTDDTSYGGDGRANAYDNVSTTYSGGGGGGSSSAAHPGGSGGGGAGAHFLVSAGVAGGANTGGGGGGGYPGGGPGAGGSGLVVVRWDTSQE